MARVGVGFSKVRSLNATLTRPPVSQIYIVPRRLFAGLQYRSGYSIEMRKMERPLSVFLPYFY